MELIHERGVLKLFSTQCHVHIAPNYSRVQMRFVVNNNEELKLCKLHIPISANFFLDTCSMIVNGEICKAEVVETESAKVKFEHEVSHGSVAANVHVSYDVIVFSLGNVKSLELVVALLGKPEVSTSVWNPKAVTVNLHIPSGAQKHKYGSSPEQWKLLALVNELCPTMDCFKITCSKNISQLECTSSTHIIKYEKEEDKNEREEEEEEDWMWCGDEFPSPGGDGDGDGGAVYNVTGLYAKHNPHSRVGEKGLILQLTYVPSDKCCLVQKASKVSC